MACCPTPTDHPQSTSLEQQAEELLELAEDPTLEQCCRRDLEEQSRIASFKAELSKHDRTLTRHQLAAAVIRSTTAADGDTDSLASDDDAELERLRTLRLQELRKAATQTTGTLETINESQLKHILDEPNSVIHLALEGSPVCDAVDECLSTLARCHKDIHFYRSLLKGGPHSANRTTLNIPPGPVILCITKDGVQLVASLAVFGAPDDFQEERLEKWLGRRLAWNDGEEESNSDGEYADDVSAPCEVCGRTYPHEHVRAMYTTRDDREDSDDDEKD